MIDKLKTIFAQIDEVNTQDPNMEAVDGQLIPKELIYGQRMTDMLQVYEADASPELQIAARGQHIKRWHIPRSDYPMDRKGYLKWRTMLKIYHGELLSEMMEKQGFSSDSIDKVVELVNKKKLKTDDESKKLEDVVCLVFLKYYFHAFGAKHDEAKLIDIVQKTWGKMTEKGHAMALELDYLDEDLALIQKALA
ncbi:DUF4202 domain-containing protein [Gilvimarinus agarilyticus]|uniref:DUF4202 domain-containing protein n=1 Tax=Reichenbachiella agariperforans TaxID=156994 RepID=UPI001C0A47B0|nr:DUF4202 domain-containing protein [Reichenbachiella agariperforans]MBU2888059.1 DUF4202 domain-containing protein [Gilvimarinus agarilyticus]MBU2913300.1 DUF4202 domain-containing protein [Reichenbachiella agariperforans]